MSSLKISAPRAPAFRANAIAASSSRFLGGSAIAAARTPARKGSACRLMVISKAKGPKLGVIGGSNLTDSTLFAHLERKTIKNEYGEVNIYDCQEDDDKQICFAKRHYAGPGESYVPPHMVPAPATIKAFKELGVERVLLVCSVGSMRKHIPPHTILLPDDYIALWNTSTYATSDKSGELLPVFDDAGRKAAIAMARERGIDKRMRLWYEEAVYVQTRGPRFETRAEIRALKGMGCDVVGMTGVSEVVLCNELKLPVTMVCFCDNWANGIGGEFDAYSEFYANVGKNVDIVEEMVEAAIDALTLAPEEVAAGNGQEECVPVA